MMGNKAINSGNANLHFIPLLRVKSFVVDLMKSHPRNWIINVYAEKML